MSDPLIKTLFHRGVPEREAQAILSRGQKTESYRRDCLVVARGDVPRAGDMYILGEVV